MDVRQGAWQILRFLASRRVQLGVVIFFNVLIAILSTVWFSQLLPDRPSIVAPHPSNMLIAQIAFSACGVVCAASLAALSARLLTLAMAAAAAGLLVLLAFLGFVYYQVIHMWTDAGLPTDVFLAETRNMAILLATIAGNICLAVRGWRESRAAKAATHSGAP